MILLGGINTAANANTNLVQKYDINGNLIATLPNMRKAR